MVLLQNETDRELSKKIQRSIGAIYTRRAKLKREVQNDN